MIGQDALVRLLIDKGVITDEELTAQVKKSKEQIFKDLSKKDRMEYDCQ